MEVIFHNGDKEFKTLVSAQIIWAGYGTYKVVFKVGYYRKDNVFTTVHHDSAYYDLIKDMDEGREEKLIEDFKESFSEVVCEWCGFVDEYFIGHI